MRAEVRDEGVPAGDGGRRYAACGGHSASRHGGELLGPILDEAFPLTTVL